MKSYVITSYNNGKKNYLTLFPDATYGMQGNLNDCVKLDKYEYAKRLTQCLGVGYYTNIEEI